MARKIDINALQVAKKRLFDKDTLRPIIRIIPVSDIVGPLFGIRDTVGFLPHQYVFVHSRDEWTKIFREVYLSERDGNDILVIPNNKVLEGGSDNDNAWIDEHKSEHNTEDEESSEEIESSEEE